jgi:hypothetical protein
MEFFISDGSSNLSPNVQCADESSIFYSGSGAVAIADILGDKNKELINANYISAGMTARDFGAIQIISAKSQSIANQEMIIPRSGLFLTMGAVKISAFDFDLDGDNDLVVALEGFDGRNGLEIYENKGSGVFERVTSIKLPTNAWSFSELQFREFEIVDINFDGYPDIVLNGWNGSLFKKSQSPDLILNSLIFINKNGKSFENPNDKDFTAIFKDYSSRPQYLKFLDSNESAKSSRFFGVDETGTPVIVKIKINY